MTAARIRTPGFGRNGSYGTERENWSLRDNILQLEEELTLTRSQLSKVTYQLQAVVTLVKRAWTGDNASSIQLAKFVGVAAPDVCMQNSCGHKRIKVIPKKHSINNWAKLTTGLLKTIHKRHDTEIAEDTLHYLNDRQQYLEEQINRNECSRKTLYRPRSSSSSDLSILRPSSTTAKVSSMERILTRRPSFDRVSEPTSQMTSEIAHHRFLIESSTQTRNQESETNADITANFHGCSDNRRPECRRFLMSNLFDVGDFVSDIHLKPPSGTLRSKSAAPIRGERSLKYETTRPVSVQVQKTKSRTQSAKLSKHRPKNPPQSVVAEKFDASLDVEEILDPVEMKRTSSPVTSESEVEDVMRQRVQEDPEMTKLKMNIRKPESVIVFDRDLLSMAELENDFIKNAVELQKRLGINTNGLIFDK